MFLSYIADNLITKTQSIIKFIDIFHFFPIHNGSSIILFREKSQSNRTFDIHFILKLFKNLNVGQTKRSRIQRKSNWHRFHHLPRLKLYPFTHTVLRVFITGEILLASNFPNSELYLNSHLDFYPTNLHYQTDGKHKFHKRQQLQIFLPSNSNNLIVCTHFFKVDNQLLNLQLLFLLKEKMVRQ